MQSDESNFDSGAESFEDEKSSHEEESPEKNKPMKEEAKYMTNDGSEFEIPLNVVESVQTDETNPILRLETSNQMQKDESKFVSMKRSICLELKTFPSE
jgi:hypothetical protein